MFDFNDKPYLTICSDNLTYLKTLPDNCIDSVVTDPPYGLGKEQDMVAVLRSWLDIGHHDIKGKGFMDAQWDAFVPQPLLWREVLRVLKPGGHCLAFYGQRTYDIGVLAMRLAGFEVRDMIGWLHAAAMPKSHNISKSIDRTLGVEQESIGKAKGMGKQNPDWNGTNKGRTENSFHPEYDKTIATSEQAKRFDGFGTGLKPLLEPIVLCRKPLDGTIAQNCMAHGTGGINIDGCRIPTSDTWIYPNGPGGIYSKKYQENNDIAKKWNSFSTVKDNEPSESSPLGRWPGNCIIDGSDELEQEFEKYGNRTSGDMDCITQANNHGIYSPDKPKHVQSIGSSGSASRFFYSAKASNLDRNEGLDERNNHPTVKPIELMRYLCRLITPPSGIVLDPFMGSGSTGKGAMLEGFKFIGIELDQDYCTIANARIDYALKNGSQVKMVRKDLFKEPIKKTKQQHVKKVKVTTQPSLFD